MTNYKRSISKLMRTISKADYKIRQAIEEGSDFASIMADHSYKSRLLFGILRHLQNKGPLPCYEDFIAAYCKGEKRLCDAPAYLRHKQACEFISSMPFGREYLEGLPERRLRSIIAKAKKLSVQKSLEYVKKLIPKADNSNDAVMDNCREVVPYNVKAMADNFHANSLEKARTIQAMPLLLCVSDKTDVSSELNADNLPDNSKYIPKPPNYDFVLGNRKNIVWDENGYIVYK